MIFVKVLLMLAPSLLAAFVHQKVNGKKFKLWQFSKTFLCYAAVINVIEIWLIAVRGYNKYFSFATMKNSLVAKYVVFGIVLAVVLPMLKKLPVYDYAVSQLSSNKDTVLQKCTLLLLAFTYVFTMFIFCYKSYTHLEIESYALPVISIQYRGDLLMCQDDLILAQRDFPKLYAGINSFKNLRVQKLLVTPDGRWESYYFPIYSILVVPFKLFLQFFKLDQELCFIFFHVACLLALFITVINSKKINFIQKSVLSILLICVPTNFYMYYISAELMIYCFVGIGMVHFYERHYKRAAVFITLAGMANSTVMAIGIVMIADWFVFIVKQKQDSSFLNWIKKQLPGAIALALCFVPSLFPFILKIKTGVSNFSPFVSNNQMIRYGMTGSMQNIPTVGANAVVQQVPPPTNSYIGRFLQYIFDPTLGLTSFAPLLVFLCIFMFVIGIFKRKYRDTIIFLCSFVGTVAAYSLMLHINSGYQYCLRYVYWTYPILAVYIGTIVYNLYQNKMLYLISNVCLIFTSSIFIFLNSPSASTYMFNRTTSVLMDIVPDLYNPMPSTFDWNVCHIDNAYKVKSPVIYRRKNGAVAKILAVEADKESLFESIRCNEKDKIWFDKKVNNLKSNKYTYINIPRYRRVFYNTYSIGDAIYWNKLYNYELSGLSNGERNYVWTDGKEINLVFGLKELPQNTLHCVIELFGVFSAFQTVNVFVNNENVLNRKIFQEQNIEFDFDPAGNDTLIVRIELPDSISPEQLKVSGDRRKLALAIKSVTFTER